MQTKRKIIIFDFNRTLYDPVNKKIFPGADEILKKMKRLGFELFLVAQDRDGQRYEIIEKTNILIFFDKVSVLPEKNFDCFKAILEENIDRSSSFVVGDYIRQEILFGNILGLKTIWIKDNSLSGNFPVVSEEHPNFVVNSINEILGIIN